MALNIPTNTYSAKCCLTLHMCYDRSLFTVDGYAACIFLKISVINHKEPGVMVLFGHSNNAGRLIGYCYVSFILFEMHENKQLKKMCREGLLTTTAKNFVKLTLELSETLVGRGSIEQNMCTVTAFFAIRGASTTLSILLKMKAWTYGEAHICD